jgi:hypothetical protein
VFPTGAGAFHVSVTLCVADLQPVKQLAVIMVPKMAARKTVDAFVLPVMESPRGLQ